MSDLKAETSVTISQKPVPKIKDISMMKAWKESKVTIDRRFLRKEIRLKLFLGISRIYIICSITQSSCTWFKKFWSCFCFTCMIIFLIFFWFSFFYFFVKHRLLTNWLIYWTNLIHLLISAHLKVDHVLVMLLIGIGIQNLNRFVFSKMDGLSKDFSNRKVNDY